MRPPPKLGERAHSLPNRARLRQRSEETRENKKMLQKLHHVAYRCADAGETVEFYSKVLGLPFAHALSNDFVPSVKEYSPHLHIFFELGDGSYIAFFELPKSPAQGK